MTNKTDVFVLSGNEVYLRDICQTLKSFYITHAYSDSAQVIEALSHFHPTALIIDEDFPGGGLALLQAIRRVPALAQIAVVFTARKGDLGSVKAAQSMGHCRPLMKPYRASVLITAISDQVNAHIEAQWQNMEPTQKAALENTLESFNSIADLVAEGEEVPYIEIRESCDPLISAVQSGDFKELLQGVRGHDNYSYVHSLRVATFLSLFGDHLGIKGEDMKILATGGLLHDVGKMLIPHRVLNKPGRLDDGELIVMRSHVTETMDFLNNTPTIPKGVCIIAGQHHEKLDGSGYPHGLKGAELNELARMASIIDVFSALTDRRCYKDPMAPDRAMAIMEEMEGHLDQHFLRSFKELLLDATATPGVLN